VLAVLTSKSPSLPISEAGKEAVENEVIVTGVVSKSHEFMYHPLDEDWRHTQCDRCGLLYCKPHCWQFYYPTNIARRVVRKYSW